ncbi:M4 family metallopeptidase, partial [Nocardioides sp.]|uniref:M4 family metallopeptidase n=1 Tax=Nocardioides sp. TaxID=35761 RepID=UPI003562BED2
VFGGLVAAVLAASAVAAVPLGAEAQPVGQTTTQDKPAVNSRAQARQSAQRLIDRKAPELRIGAHDGFVADRVLSSEGINYVPYERTHRGLPVRGGDFVVVTGRRGEVLTTSVAQGAPTRLASIRPTLAKGRARAIARGELRKVEKVGATRLVVLQQKGSHLAWETRVTGRDAGEHSIQSVLVDAHDGRVLSTREHVHHGQGTAAYSGPNPLSLTTSLSGSTYSMKDPASPSRVCQDSATNTTFSGTDDLWGNGNATSKETGCVDAFFGTQMLKAMLTTWLGRSGMDGVGGWVPMRVGLNDVNAYYDGTQVQIGKNQAGQWIGSLDVVAHEYGHGIDDKTPGGISQAGTQEFIGDVFGALTEAWSNQASAYDPPDYLVGEEINLTGQGPIRNMHNPSAVGHPNCYSSAIPTTQVHAAAGPGNHWFYLLAEGSNPTNGNPASSTCNGSSVTGIGIQKAGKILYNAMLMKTSSSSYLKYRTWTLTAAKNLYPGSCTEFNTVKAAWDAVSVPAQAGDPTCSTGGGGSQLLLNPGFESGAVNWTGTAGPITNNTGRPARTGSWKMWLGGNGTTSSEYEQQSVTIPSSAASATLSFWIRIDTAESGSTAYDTTKVQIIDGGTTTTLATYSNVNATSTYVQKTFDVTAYKGKTITVKFLLAEDSSLQTSFVVDDTALSTT